MSNIDDDQKTRFQPKRAVPEGTTVASPSHRATLDRAVPKPVSDDRTRFAPRSKAASQVPNTADGRTVVKPSRKPAAGPAQDKTRIHSSTAVGDQLRSQSQPNQRPAPTRRLTAYSRTASPLSRYWAPVEWVSSTKPLTG